MGVTLLTPGGISCCPKKSAGEQRSSGSLRSLCQIRSPNDDSFWRLVMIILIIDYYR